MGFICCNVGGLKKSSLGCPDRYCATFFFRKYTILGDCMSLNLLLVMHLTSTTPAKNSIRKYKMDPPMISPIHPALLIT